MKKIIGFVFSVIAVTSAAVMCLVGYYDITLSDAYCVTESGELEFSDSDILSCGDNIKEQSIAVQKSGAEPVTSYDTTVSLFGIVPVKSVHVTVSKSDEVQILGTPFGIKIYTEGVLVVGFNDVQTSEGAVNPAANAGIKLGDSIVKIGNETVVSGEQVREIISKYGKNPIEFTLKRDGKTTVTTVCPAYSESENIWLTGIWVRDSSAGIGTLTFYSPKSGVAAGLGHGICDSDTDKLIPLQSGEFLQADIVGIKKSHENVTGELQGVFSGGKVADFAKNCITGVYGVNCCGFSSEFVVPVAMKQEIKVGKATVLTTLDSEGAKQYECEIVKIYHNDDSKIKNMIVKITDKELIAKTGGIVQGMSGSPIIQNGKFIGAVTHVFVDDSTSGYAIFAENMLAEATKVQADQLDAAS